MLNNPVNPLVTPFDNGNIHGTFRLQKDAEEYNSEVLNRTIEICESQNRQINFCLMSQTTFDELLTISTFTHKESGEKIYNYDILGSIKLRDGAYNVLIADFPLQKGHFLCICTPILAKKSSGYPTTMASCENAVQNTHGPKQSYPIQWELKETSITKLQAIVSDVLNNNTLTRPLTKDELKLIGCYMGDRWNSLFKINIDEMNKGNNKEVELRKQLQEFVDKKQSVSVSVYG